MRPCVNPTARSRPTSRARCSTPSLKNSAASSSAESDEKEAEIGEVLAEIGRARATPPVRRRARPAPTAPLPADRGWPAAPRRAIARLRQRLVGRRRDADRRAVAVARPPQPLADVEADERLRRGAELLPVVLVDGRTRRRSIGNGGSQSPIDVGVGQMPGYTGARLRSAASPASARRRRLRKSARARLEHGPAAPTPS